MLENLEINGEIIPHTVFPIIKDGGCLFHALSFLMFGHQTNMNRVRVLIVEHIILNWERFQVLTHDPCGNNYNSEQIYRVEMLRPTTFGSHCGLVAAGEIFNFLFEIFYDGKIIMSYGEQIYPTKRLRFTGDLSRGHFDAYVVKPVRNLQVAQINETEDFQENPVTDDPMEEVNNDSMTNPSDNPSDNFNIPSSIFDHPQKFSEDKFPTQNDALQLLFFVAKEKKSLNMFTEEVAHEIDKIWKRATIPIISPSSIRIKVNSQTITDNLNALTLEHLQISKKKMIS